MRLADATWPEVPERPLVLLPIGSTEQHGPHLPFDTDARIAAAVAAGAARALEQRLAWSAMSRPADGHEQRLMGSGGPGDVGDLVGRPGGRVVVAPALVYGASGEHQGFPGTVSIGHEALHFVLLELARSLRTWAGRVVIVNGHGGNVPTLASAVPQLIREQHPIAWAPCAPLPASAAPDAAPAHPSVADAPPGPATLPVANAHADMKDDASASATLPAADAHAGRWETSLMLHLDPSVVRMPLPPAGEVRPMSELLPALTADGVAGVSPSGILGDPTGASAAEGAAILRSLVDALVERIVTAAPDPRGMLTAKPTSPAATPPAAAPPGGGAS